MALLVRVNLLKDFDTIECKEVYVFEQTHRRIFAFSFVERNHPVLHYSHTFYFGRPLILVGQFWTHEIDQLDFVVLCGNSDDIDSLSGSIGRRCDLIPKRLISECKNTPLMWEPSPYCQRDNANFGHEVVELARPCKMTLEKAVEITSDQVIMVKPDGCGFILR